jgi:hypothetical protein
VQFPALSINMGFFPKPDPSGNRPGKSMQGANDPCSQINTRSIPDSKIPSGIAQANRSVGYLASLYPETT